MKYLARLLVFVILFLPVAVSAEIQTIVCEGTYNMGDGETPTVAESRALLNAKRIAVEQAGTYVESYSKVKNFQLTADEIKILASGVMEVTVLDKKRTVVGDGFRFWVKIKALVNSDKMDQMAGKVKDKAVIEDYKKIQDAYDRSQKEIEVLKKQLLQAKGDQKKDVEAKITADEKQFQANEWYEKGRKLLGSAQWYGKKEDYDKALEAFTVVIAMDPQYAKAYVYRGDIYLEEKNPEKALSDFQKAWSLCSEKCRKDNEYLLYCPFGNVAKQIAAKGDAENNKKYYYKAIEILMQYLGYYDKYFTDKFACNYYYPLAYAYVKTEQWRKANEFSTKALKEGIYDQNRKRHVLLIRGVSYQKLGDNRNAISDYQEACNLGNEAGCKAARSLRGQ
ncbi:MAG: tetratricopeptide repeat protein [Syntrophales bacterium]